MQIEAICPGTRRTVAHYARRIACFSPHPQLRQFNEKLDASVKGTVVFGRTATLKLNAINVSERDSGLLRSQDTESRPKWQRSLWALGREVAS
jgi:hypothetical protein